MVRHRRSGGPVLEVRGLRKRYDEVEALRGVDLDVGEGQVVCLLGPNGAGKTTLVSIVAGLRRRDAGSVSVGGFDPLTHPRRARRLLGLAPQELGIYPIVTVRQNLLLFGELAGLSGVDLRDAAERTATVLGIEETLDRQAGTLSGGQKRRLHTAVAMLHEPPLLLLDEATVGADVETRGQLLRLVGELAAGGSSVLYSTHYLGEVEQLDADVVIVDHGQVIARGHVRDLIARYATPAVELTFEGTPPDIDGATRVGSDRVRVPTDDPARTTARLLTMLGSNGDRLAGIEVRAASLETVYLAITGREYDPDAARDARPEEVEDVLAGK